MPKPNVEPLVQENEGASWVNLAELMSDPSSLLDDLVADPADFYSSISVEVQQPTWDKISELADQSSSYSSSSDIQILPSLMVDESSAEEGIPSKENPLETPLDKKTSKRKRRESVSQVSKKAARISNGGVIKDDQKLKDDQKILELVRKKYKWDVILSLFSNRKMAAKTCIRRFERVWGLLKYDDVFWNAKGPIKIILGNGRKYRIELMPTKESNDYSVIIEKKHSRNPVVQWMD